MKFMMNGAVTCGTMDGANIAGALFAPKINTEGIKFFTVPFLIP